MRRAAAEGGGGGACSHYAMLCLRARAMRCLHERTTVCYAMPACTLLCYARYLHELSRRAARCVLGRLGKRASPLGAVRVLA